MRKVFFALAISICACVAAPGGAFADSPGRLVSKGNGHYNKKDYVKALESYDRASVKAPESAIIAFDKGDAFYKKGDLEKAREQFQQAASKTKSLPFEAKAWYNLGNCAFKDGGRQEDSDLKKALQSYEESVKFYGTSLQKNPSLKVAAENLEIARLKIKDLLDKIKNQEKQGGQKQQQNQQNQQGQEKQQQQGQQNQEQQGQNQQDKEKQQQAGAEDKEQQKKQGDKNKQGADKNQQKKQLARDATAREILDDEKQDRKDRQLENAGGYRPVEKDW